MFAFKPYRHEISNLIRIHFRSICQEFQQKPAKKICNEVKLEYFFSRISLELDQEFPVQIRMNPHRKQNIMWRNVDI